jgi:ATP-dependent Clp protease adaptor protein ClpS
VLPEAPVLVPETDTTTEASLAPRWRVILLDDDVTTIDFVVDLLKTVFAKPQAEAVRLTYEIHHTGSALITVVPRERAELYVEQVRSLARPRGFPLTATIEPE